MVLYWSSLQAHCSAEYTSLLIGISSLLQACTGPDDGGIWHWPIGYHDSVLWNGMIVPLLRTVHSGVAWYQGENNAAYPRRYNCSFPALINDWRLKWAKYTDGATDIAFPFGWAQIATAGDGGADYKGRVFNPKNPPSSCGSGCAPSCNTSCLGEFHEWGDYGNGFTGIRHAQVRIYPLDELESLCTHPCLLHLHLTIAPPSYPIPY
jgi:hypothetical protein